MLGFVNVFKPAGLTSTQVGTFVRKIFERAEGTKPSAGHLGTLDPMACGVLPLALGRATRLLALIEDRRKAYVFTLVLGRTTTTGDATGETVTFADVPPDAETRLALAAMRFVGTIEQLPPMVSALHHRGQRLYEIARRGETVPRVPRKVTIYGLNVVGYRAGVARISLACSEGTYVRSLCEDLAEAIGCRGHMGTLLREASGPFVLSEAHTLEEIERSPRDALVSPERIIPFPTVVLDGRNSADFRAGRLVPLPLGSAAKHVFVRDSTRRLVGVGEAVGALLAPRKVFV